MSGLSQLCASEKDDYGSTQKRDVQRAMLLELIAGA
jgi:hypothetical protein